MDTSVDTTRLAELMEESQDTHSDSMRAGKDGLSNYVEALHDTHGRTLGRAAVLAGVAGAGLLVATGRASAATVDVQALQTAASIENLAIAAYEAAAGLSFIKDGNATVLAFAKMTLTQHMDHLAAFNAAAVSAGGAKQTAPDPKYLPTLTAAAPKLKTPADVVALAITLENVAAETYTKDASLVSTATLRSLFVSVAGVEAQHVAVLLAVQALLATGNADLIELGPPTAKLPAAAGSVGFPNPYYLTTSASPVTEGAVQ